VRRGADIVSRQWRAVAGAVLLLALAFGSLYYNTTPNIWAVRALETIQQLPFMR
jgi:hypothetical protein